MLFEAGSVYEYHLSDDLGQWEPNMFWLRHKTAGFFLAPKYGWNIVRKRY
jgi:hypothetical protein